MSENLDLVRSIYADWERGDFGSAEWADPAVEFEIADGPDPAKVNGVAEMAGAFREFLSMWNGLRVKAQEYRELDGDRFLVCVHNSGRAKASGVEIGNLMGTTDGANLLAVRNGKVIRFVLYFDRKRALADLGLVE
jgi:hypothetical protein